MFGLLQNKKLTIEEFSDFRLNYCGTCKTIGKLYGHKERLLLNFDVVFLSELLAAVYNRREDFNYIKPYTCLTLPSKEEHIPQFLKYTASINILLGHYKILDNANDAKYKFNIWILFQYLTNSNFRKAKKYLIELKLPVDDIDKQIKEQFNREKEKILFDNLEGTLKYYSNQTAQITGLAFKHSVSSCNDEQLSRTFWEIGQVFGEIVYIIDAIEDYGKDKKNEVFNLFLLYDLEDKSKMIEKAKVYIYERLEQIKSCINLLPISEVKQKTFASNLVLNINGKISPTKCCSSAKNCTNKGFSFKERYQFAIATAKSISLKKKNAIMRFSSFTFLTVLLLLFFNIFPHFIYAANDATPKTDCCKDCGEFNCGKCGDGHCCANCCESSCGDACGTGKCRELGDICQQAPCLGCCCGPIIVTGCASCCIGSESAGPEIIVKTIKVPAKGCCDR